MYQVHFNNILQLSTKSPMGRHQAVFLHSFLSFLIYAKYPVHRFLHSVTITRMITKHFLHQTAWNVSYTSLPAEKLIFFDYCGMLDRRVRFPVTTVLHLKEE